MSSSAIFFGGKFQFGEGLFVGVERQDTSAFGQLVFGCRYGFVAHDIEMAALGALLGTRGELHAVDFQASIRPYARSAFRHYSLADAFDGSAMGAFQNKGKGCVHGVYLFVRLCKSGVFIFRYACYRAIVLTTRFYSVLYSPGSSAAMGIS